MFRVYSKYSVIKIIYCGRKPIGILYININESPIESTQRKGISHTFEMNIEPSNI
jgi:hypothetical protein